MPIYEFKCKKCGTLYESLCFRSNGEDRGPCPSCGAEDSEKMMSTFASMGADSGKGLGSLSSSASCGSHGGFS